MALATADTKHGTAVVISGSTCGQWELLDKHPKPAHWWLHRRNAAGDWETTYEHTKNLHRVASGSRHEYAQSELEAA
jgi:hypothetical protein